MKRSQKRLLIFLALVIAALVLSGCGGIVDDPETGQLIYEPGIFEPIAAPIRLAITFFHDRLEPIAGVYAWGWAIIAVTLIIRLLLLPLGLKQMKSMREASIKMKMLQPELDALKKKYSKNKQKLQEEQMKLYQKHGITQAQMAGCLPTLLQMPILLAFYYAILGLLVTSGFPGSPFYFIPDLAYPGYRDGFTWIMENLSLQGLLKPDVWPYLVLPAILAVTQYAMTKMSQATQIQPSAEDNPAAGMMGQMTLLMTGMFVFFALQVPAGLSLYWVVGNVLALLQQVYVNRQTTAWDEAVALSPSVQSSAGEEISESGDASTANVASAANEGGKPKQAKPAKSKTPPPQARTRRKRRKRR
ncbi:MAG: YidC/Oxa1 family membrane protein insertase [Chloroflexi bacterium]|nr:YidC/Oxa1 family membrane protein insertase [Chloroflexota bacterium]